MLFGLLGQRLQRLPQFCGSGLLQGIAASSRPHGAKELQGT